MRAKIPKKMTEAQKRAKRGELLREYYLSFLKPKFKAGDRITGPFYGIATVLYASQGETPRNACTYSVRTDRGVHESVNEDQNLKLAHERDRSRSRTRAHRRDPVKVSVRAVKPARARYEIRAYASTPRSKRGEVRVKTLYFWLDDPHYAAVKLLELNADDPSHWRYEVVDHGASLTPRLGTVVTYAELVRRANSYVATDRTRRRRAAPRRKRRIR